jgi:hypothetical protein
VFAYAHQHAKEQAADNLEAELYRRAMASEGGMPDTLGIFLLKGYRPMFRENYTVNVNSKMVSANVNLSELPSSDRIALLQYLLEEEQGQVVDAEVRHLPPTT